MLFHSARGRLKFCILAAFVFGSAASFAACSSPHPVMPAVPAARMAHPQTESSATPTPSPTPYQFTFTTVDNPKSSNTKLYGLDDWGQVEGTVVYDSAGDSQGFFADPPFTKFYALKYPGSSSTVLRSQNPAGRIYCGYFLNGTQGNQTWGFIRNHAVYNSFKDNQTPKGGQSINELLGINDNDIAVGFYQDSDGHDHAYELAGLHFVGIKPPGAVTAKAVAVSLAGFVAGVETLSGGKTQGWLLRNGTFISIAYPGSQDTEVYGLSDAVSDNTIVGSYVDSYGNTHGFILKNPAGGGDAVWQTVDEPNADGTTVITGMNNHREMTGWYVDSNGITHGFYAALQS